VDKRLTITEVADMVGISTKTLARWEKSGKIRRAKRDWRGWRVYEETDISEIRRFHEMLVEV
jgi:excisionase family DNA binding protein